MQTTTTANEVVFELSSADTQKCADMSPLQGKVQIS